MLKPLPPSRVVWEYSTPDVAMKMSLPGPPITGVGVLVRVVALTTASITRVSGASVPL